MCDRRMMGLMTTATRRARTCRPCRNLCTCNLCTCFTLIGVILGASVLYLGQLSNGYIDASFQSNRALESPDLHNKQHKQDELQPGANRPDVQLMLGKTPKNKRDVVADNRNLDRGARQGNEMYRPDVAAQETPGEGRVGIVPPPLQAVHLGQQPDKRRMAMPFDEGFQRMQPRNRSTRGRPDRMEPHPGWVPKARWRDEEGLDVGPGGNNMRRPRRPGGMQQKPWAKNIASPADEMPESPIFLPPGLHTPGNITWDYKVNANHSDTIPLNRNVPDVRPDECKSIKYDDRALPNITIVIPFYNEVASLLLRTIHAILVRTPYHLLHEIILVDDCSDNANLMEPLANYLRALDPKITLLRNTERQGLIRTRQRAADMATGDVLIFLDSHTEPGFGWAQPLLQFLKESPYSVLQPGLVHIDKETFRYGRGGTDGANMGRTAFGWELAIRWMGPPPNATRNVPYKVPTFLGCVLVIRREWFVHLGGFDMAMDLWGGENMELGFRAWMCGGSAYTHPCSRVGHVFRPLPYSSENLDQGILRNNARVAEVWMEGYTHLFYGAVHRPVELTEGDHEAIAERRALKKRLNCTSFDVILKHVVPDMPVPPPDASYFGFVRPGLDPAASSSCLGLASDLSTVHLVMHSCPKHHIKQEMTFYLDSHGRLLHGNDSGCVLVNWKDMSLHISSCEAVGGSKGMWSAKADDPSRVNAPLRIVFTQGQKEYCLTRNMMHKSPSNRSYPVSLVPCSSDGKKERLWTFTYNFQAIPPAAKTRQNVDGNHRQRRVRQPRDMRGLRKQPHGH